MSASDNQELDGYVGSMQPSYEILKAKIEKLEDALEFYANPETYFAIGFFPDPPNGDFMNDFEETELGYKPGKKAREALEDKDE